MVGGLIRPLKGIISRAQHKDTLIPWPGALKSFSEALKSFSRALKSFSEALKVGITLARPLSRYITPYKALKALLGSQLGPTYWIPIGANLLDPNWGLPVGIARCKVIRIRESEKQLGPPWSSWPSFWLLPEFGFVRSPCRPYKAL